MLWIHLLFEGYCALFVASEVGGVELCEFGADKPYSLKRSSCIDTEEKWHLALQILTPATLDLET